MRVDALEDLDAYEIEESELKRFYKESSDYLRRLNNYRERLAKLEPDSIDTEDVYIGLVKRQDGAGTVPDAIMHGRPEPAHERRPQTHLCAACQSGR